MDVACVDFVISDVDIAVVLVVEKVVVDMVVVSRILLRLNLVSGKLKSCK